MNKSIEEYFDAVESMLVESPAIASYQLLQRLIGPIDGKLRTKAVLAGGGLAEFFLYVVADPFPRLVKYSFHCQDPNGTLWKRWDNASHFPELPNAPHHVHLADGRVVSGQKEVDLGTVLLELEYN